MVWEYERLFDDHDLKKVWRFIEINLKNAYIY